jgi:hypothetical protein
MNDSNPVKGDGPQPDTITESQPHIVVGTATADPTSTPLSDTLPVSIAPQTSHPGAKTYVIISMAVMFLGTIPPILFLISISGQPGSEFLLLPLIPIFIAVGFIGLLNLFLLPRFLHRKYFEGTFRIITAITLAFSILIALFGAMQVAGVFRSASVVKQSEHRGKQETAYYAQQNAQARSEATVEQATQLLNSCQVFGFYYTNQNGINGSENAEATKAGILLYRIPKSYDTSVTTPASGDAGKHRMHIADRMVATMVPIARNAQHSCGIQFWHDGDYEQWKAGHWYFKGTLVV